ncbi:hypothetical protein KJ819_01340 [Patescibacteria group bacterium]|nr:hypothetical protein [Patescibacteria group bacterium]MBU1501073.1 hypothetical protein [Patescibacteria group bacterium]MBU2081054.1 hypothetical protein [Patescibacteria group bacterium]MBU2124145.1 hypothetical protein [Patescibacteria group bacterium]MBU2195001.1 hypothetical protein [Patescibacteria group bacterium]
MATTVTLKDVLSLGEGLPSKTVQACACVVIGLEALENNGTDAEIPAELQVLLDDFSGRIQKLANT